jgi:quinol monooxygenase YgiN
MRRSLMATDVSWLLEMNVQPGREKDFRNLMSEMVAATSANEPGTLNYEWSTSADGRICHLFERYSDSAAVMIHLTTFGEKFAGRFLEIFKPTRFVVYGAPDGTVKEALTAFNPVYMQSVGGFGR